MLLFDIVAKFRHIIENKKTDGANLQQKHAAWLEVVKMYNSGTTGYARTLESLQQTYKNLKKKAKKTAFDAKMAIPVDKETLVSNIKEYGTSSKGWKKVAENTGVSEVACQEMFIALTKEADVKDRILKQNIMRTGGGPPPNKDNDPLLEKVKALVGPVMDGMFTIYDGDSEFMASQKKTPIEAGIVEPEPIFSSLIEPVVIEQNDKTPDSEIYFTTDRANLKKKTTSFIDMQKKT